MALIAQQTGSILEGIGGRDRTGTGLSTNIIIKVGPVAVGAIQSISISESRTIGMVDEVGADGHIDSLPTKSTDITAECQRIRFDRLRISEAFSRGFLHVHSQRIPFDIDIYDRWLGDGANSIVTTLKNCWINRINYAYRASDWIVTDDMSITCETIYSTLNGSNAATGGERGPNIMQINQTERESDVGSRRGSLDVPGLINDFFSNV